MHRIRGFISISINDTMFWNNNAISADGNTLWNNNAKQSARSIRK